MTEKARQIIKKANSMYRRADRNDRVERPHEIFKDWHYMWTGWKISPDESRAYSQWWACHLKNRGDGHCFEVKMMVDLDHTTHKELAELLRLRKANGRVEFEKQLAVHDRGLVAA